MRFRSRIKLILFFWLILALFCPMGILDISESCKKLSMGLSIVKTSCLNILFPRKDVTSPNGMGRNREMKPDESPGDFYLEGSSDTKRGEKREPSKRR